MLVSAVILSYNSERHLEPCLNSLLQALSSFREPSEIFVVENGSSDRSPGILGRFEDKHPDIVKGLYQERNLGTTASRNLALQRATGRYILVLDSDVVVPRGTLHHLVDFLATDKRCGIVAPRLTYPDGRNQLSVDQFPTIWRKAVRLFSLKSIERNTLDAAAISQPREVDYAVSAFWLFRCQLLSEVGYLDERFFYAPEDVDYCLRTWLHGYRVIYDPRVHAFHDARELSRGGSLNPFTLHHLLGLFRYFLKHRYAFSGSALYRRIERAQSEGLAKTSGASIPET